MSEEQKMRAEEVIERISKKEKLLNKLLYTLIGSIVVMVSSVAVLTNSSIQNRKEIDYVRISSANKDAFNSYQKIDKAHDLAILKAINDPETAEAIEYFNKEKEAVVDLIFSSQLEIVPRSVEVNNVKKFAK